MLEISYVLAQSMIMVISENLKSWKRLADRELLWFAWLVFRLELPLLFQLCRCTQETLDSLQNQEYLDNWRFYHLRAQSKAWMVSPYCYCIWTCCSRLPTSFRFEGPSASIYARLETYHFWWRQRSYQSPRMYHISRISSYRSKFSYWK